MATIPVGNFGNATPGQAPMVRAPNVQVSSGAFGGGIADATQQLGNQGMAIANDMREQNVAMARAKTANAVLDHEIAVKGVTTDINNQIQTGQIPYEQGAQAYQDAIGKIDVPKIDNADPVTMENFARGVQRLNFQGQVSTQGAVQEARRADFKGQYGAALDKLGKLGGMPGADIDKINAQAEAFGPLAKQAGLNDAVVAKSLQDFKDQNWTNHATQTAIENRDDLAGLQQLAKDLTTKDGYYADKIDTNKRNAILSGVETHIIMLQNRAAAQTNRADAQAEKTNDKLESDVMTGIPVSQNRINNDFAFVKGMPDQEKRFQGILDMGNSVQSMLTRPPAEQQYILDSMRADLAAKGADYPARQKKLLDTLTAAHDSFTKTLKDEPLQVAAMRFGQQFTPLTAAAMTDITQIPAIMADRENWAMTVKKQYGPDVQPRLFFNGEADMIKGALAAPTATPDYQRKFLGILKGTMSDTAFDASMDQIGADPLIKMAGKAEALGSVAATKESGPFMTTTYSNGRPLSQLLLEGRKLLQDKTTLMPKEKSTGGDAMAPEFNKLVGDALPRGDMASENAYKGVHAIYAVLAKDAGKNDGVLDNDLLRQAVNIMTGGVFDHAGGKVIPPYAMSEDKFNDKLREQIDATSGRTQLTPDALWQLPLESTKAGYVFKNGRSYVPDNTGRPLTINLEAPSPGATPSAAAVAPAVRKAKDAPKISTDYTPVPGTD